MPQQYRALLIVIIIFLGFPVYFLPAFLAARREHPKRRKILLLNTLTAWTGIGWVWLLFLAVRGMAAEKESDAE